MTNAVFLPIIYFFYPETGMLLRLSFGVLTKYHAANRSLEDLDAYYRSNPSLQVTGDPNAISRKRPQKYIEREDEQFVKTAVKKGVLPAEEAEHLEYSEESRPQRDIVHLPNQ